MDSAMPVDPIVERRLRLPLSDGRNLALVHAFGRVLSSEVEDGHITVVAELPESLARRLKGYAEEAVK
jgi:hypothetical protein